MMCFIAMTIVLSIRLVGIMLLDEFADLASNNGKPVYFRLQEDHMGKYRDRLSWVACPDWSFLIFLNVPSGAFIILVFGGPLFGLESNKTGCYGVN